MLRIFNESKIARIFISTFNKQDSQHHNMLHTFNDQRNLRRMYINPSQWSKNVEKSYSFKKYYLNDKKIVGEGEFYLENNQEKKRVGRYFSRESKPSFHKDEKFSKTYNFIHPKESYRRYFFAKRYKIKIIYPELETPTKPLVDPIIHIEPLVNSCFTLYKDLKLSCPKMCELRKAESELWIYGYDFPSKLSPSLVQEFINFLELNFGKVSEYVALPLSYPFADFKFPYNKFKRETLSRMIKYARTNHSHQQQSNSEMIRYAKTNHGHQQQSNKSNNVEDKKEQDIQYLVKKVRRAMAGKLLTTQAIKNYKYGKIEKHNFNRDNSSAILFKFEDFYMKYKFLKPYYRVYGLTYKKFHTVRFEYGIKKASVLVRGVPWGAKSRKLLSRLNSAMEPVKIVLEKIEDSLLTTSYLFIQFDSLIESMAAIALINQLYFDKSYLKASLTYGGCYIYGYNYKYSLVIRFTYEHLQSLLEYSNIYNVKFKPSSDK